MPMTQPYRTYYSHGDVFYGLAGPREQLRRFLGVPDHAVWTIDQFDTFAQSREGGQAAPGLVHHAGFNEAVAEATGSVSTIVDLNAHENWRDEDAAAFTGSVARRKCKTGLEYIARNFPDCVVHFCLLGLDFASVGSKSYPGPGTVDQPMGAAGDAVLWHEKSRSITGAELRWLYRNSHDAGVRRIVQFWHVNTYGWQPCGAPWEDGAVMPSGGIEAFRTYHDARVARGAMDVDG